MTDIIFLDKDKTLGCFYAGEKGLYPNVIDFLDLQKQKERKLYITTTANDEGRKHLADISDKLDGYFGSQQIDSSYLLYILPDGRIRNVYDDYIERKEFESKRKRKKLDDEAGARAERLNTLPFNSEERATLQKEINTFFDYWGQLLHKETREPFDEYKRFTNPYGKFSKDLYLARRLIAPHDYESLRTVMVGDLGDDTTVLSDPQTPLIVISNNVREGNWQIVAKMLDKLFSDDNLMPWEVYDHLFNESTKNQPSKRSNFRDDGETRSLSLNGIKIALRKGSRDERIIYCP